MYLLKGDLVGTILWPLLTTQQSENISCLLYLQLHLRSRWISSTVGFYITESLMHIHNFSATQQVNWVELIWRVSAYLSPVNPQHVMAENILENLTHTSQHVLRLCNVLSSWLGMKSPLKFTWQNHASHLRHSLLVSLSHDFLSRLACFLLQCFHFPEHNAMIITTLHHLSVYTFACPLDYKIPETKGPIF